MIRTPNGFRTAIDESTKNSKAVLSTPDRIRTCDLRVRNALLYPAELRGRLGCKDLFEFTLLAVRLEDRLGTGNRGCLCC